MPAPDELPSPERIDREIRLNEAWHAADEMARGQVREERLSGEDAERAVEIWRDLYSYDTAPDTSQYEILQAEGVELPPPEELTDTELHAKLWEIIRNLASRNTFLHNTDHLSDRELYTYLVDRGFHEVTKDVIAPGWIHGIDMIGSGSEEDIELYFRYYADDSAREQWLKQFPDDVLPPREERPYDRDRLLPQPQL